MKQHIFIVDDEEDILELVSINLQREHFQISTFDSGESFLIALEEKKPDLILLDLMLPDINGLEVCRFLRITPQFQDIPIIIITAKETETDKVLGLELGADDYITKPFSSKELCARVKAVLRRSTQNSEDAEKNEPQIEGNDLPEMLTFKNKIQLNTKTYKVYVNKKLVFLTSTEFKILLKFLVSPGWVHSRDSLLKYLWNNKKLVSDRTIDVHIKHLRDKLGKMGEHIVNIRGVGYKFE